MTTSDLQPLYSLYMLWRMAQSFSPGVQCTDEKSSYGQLNVGQRLITVSGEMSQVGDRHFGWVRGVPCLNLAIASL